MSPHVDGYGNVLQMRPDVATPKKAEPASTPPRSQTQAAPQSIPLILKKHSVPQPPGPVLELAAVG